MGGFRFLVVGMGMNVDVFMLNLSFAVLQFCSSAVCSPAVLSVDQLAVRGIAHYHSSSSLSSLTFISHLIVHCLTHHYFFNHPWKMLIFQCMYLGGKGFGVSAGSISQAA